MNKRDMTFEHMVDVAEACQACENLQSVHAILHAAGQTEEEIDTMWSRREDCWWSHNFGGMNSRQAVIRGWANGLANNSKFWYSLLVKTYPEVEGMDPRPLMECAVHMLASSIIEVAEDGETAKGLWFCLGCNAEVTTRGPEASWTWGYFAGDFVYENDDWKIWHLQYLNDIDSLCGQSWGKEVTPYPEEDVFAPLGQFEMPPYTVAETVRPLYRVDRPLTLTPRIPEPYDTFANTFTYGKEAAR